MKPNEEKIVMYDSDEAATAKTTTVWISKGGRYFLNEDSARYDGSTHSFCECGALAKRPYKKCEQCRAKDAEEKFLKLPFKEWDYETPVYSDRFDKYFFDEEDIIDFIAESLEDAEEDEKSDYKNLQLLLCRPNNYQELDSGYWEDILPEDGEIHDELQKAINALNEVVRKLPAASWTQSNIRTEYIYREA